MNYQLVCKALALVSGDLHDIATQTQEIITVGQAHECHHQLASILNQLILAARISNQLPSWHAAYSTQNVASIISASSTETSTACAWGIVATIEIV